MFVTPTVHRQRHKRRYYTQRGLKWMIEWYQMKTTKIIKAELYYNPLTDIQLRADILYHSFLVLETDAHEYISIEKQVDYIVFQKSDNKHRVTSFFNGIHRRTGLNGLVGVHSYKSFNITTDFTMQQLVLYIQKARLVNQHYHVINANCQHFSIFLYNYITSQSITVDEMNTATKDNCSIPADQITGRA